MDRYIGLDAHVSSCTFGVVGPSGKRLGHQVVETNAQALVAVVRAVAGTRHLCLEEGTLSGWLYEVLSPHVAELVVAGVSESRGSKNDKLDAFARAEQLRIGAIPKKVYKGQGGFARLRHLAKGYAKLVGDSVRVQNRIKSLLRSRGLAVSGRGVYAIRGREEWLSRLPEAARPQAELLYRQHDALVELRKVAQKAMVAEARRHRAYRLGGPVPGWVDRLAGGRGFCRAPAEPVIHSFAPHFGEEIPLTGRRGSGTIFFSNCNLRCVFCQNWPIAHEGRGQEISDDVLAAVMLELQRLGCHNINVVTPTHVMPNILQATRLALHQGLRIPLVYNTGGYERPEVIRLLDGVVDIYLPDIKYMDGAQAARYSAAARDYPEVATASVREMHRQVGGLVTDQDGLALRGLMIRHLVMPNRVAGTRAFVEWVARELSGDTYVNIMGQYRVDYQAFNHPRIARAITPREFLEAMDWAEDAGLTHLDARSVAQRQVYLRRRG